MIRHKSSFSALYKDLLHVSLSLYPAGRVSCALLLTCSKTHYAIKAEHIKQVARIKC